MWNKVSEFLSRDISSIPTTGFVLIIVGALLFVLLNIFLIKICKNKVIISGKNSHSYIKIIMIAIVPTIFNIAAVFDYILPVKLVIAVTAIACIAVTIWNCMTFGPVYGLLLSYLHILGGVSAGLMIAAFVFMIVVMVVMVFFIGGTVVTDTRKVGRVHEPFGTEYFDVLAGQSDAPYINRNGERLYLHGGDGQFYDDYGNIYVVG